MPVGSFSARVGAGRSVVDVKALIATADKRIADAVAAEAAARSALDAHEAAQRHATEAFAIRERALIAERGRHESNVLASTAELEGLLDRATKRQQQAAQAEKDNAVLFVARAAELAERHRQAEHAVTQVEARAAGLDARQAALDARETELNKPKTSWLKRIFQRKAR